MITIVSQIIHSIEAFATMDFYLDPNYFGVWSKIMMPGPGPPPAEFYYYSIDYDEFFKVSNNFGVEFVEVTHSIPKASIPVLKTPEGTVVYACDFRLDDYSEIAKTNYKKLKKIGGEGVHALIVESTRVSERGKTPSEKVVREKFKEIIEFIDRGLVIQRPFQRTSRESR